MKVLLLISRLRLTQLRADGEAALKCVAASQKCCAERFICLVQQHHLDDSNVHREKYLDD